MSSEPAKEWDEMSEQTRDEIKARLIAACETEAKALPRHGHVVVTTSGRLAHLPGI